jgi:hypothetical protein
VYIYFYSRTIKIFQISIENKSGQNEKEHNVGCKGRKNFGNSKLMEKGEG